MKTFPLITLAAASLFAHTAAADTAPETPEASPAIETPTFAPAAAPATAPAPAPTAAPTTEPAPTTTAAAAAAPATAPTGATTLQESHSGWQRPPGTRLLHGIRIGGMTVMHYDDSVRDNGMTIKDEFGLKTNYMMLLGYEAMYRIVGHSWLNVVLVGNVTVAGLEQSKFIPAASGLIGAELNESFQLGIGVNLTPDEQAPSHMIAAAGWTPKVGSIYTPFHVFFVPDPNRNHRVGVTLGVTW